MTKVAISEVSMEGCLLNNPYEILFEIFRRLPKAKLIEISRLCSKFRKIAGNKRLWKDVYIKYEPNQNYAFEELYSEPWPVKHLDLSQTQIFPPVSPQPYQLIVKVTKLQLSPTRAEKVAMDAILAKYRCKELYLDNVKIGFKGYTMGIAAEAFSKQTAIEVLAVGDMIRLNYFGEDRGMWLAQALRYCKRLKILNLGRTNMSNSEMLCFAKYLPSSLEKLLIAKAWPGDSFFQVLTETTPNLRELELGFTSVKCPSLVKFEFLEALRIVSWGYQDMNDLCEHLLQFPSLKTVYVNGTVLANFLVMDDQNFPTMLQSYGISVKIIEEPKLSHPVDCDLWQVSRTV